MAVAAVSDSNNRVEDMEGTPTIADIGAGAGGGKETVTYFQGAASVSRKVTNTAARGTGVSVTAVDMTAGDDKVWLAKSLLTDFQAVNSVGWFLRISDGTNYFDYMLLNDSGFPGIDVNEFPRGGWIVTAIDPSLTTWAYTGTATVPTASAITTFQVGCGLATGSAKSENIFLDSIDLGDGLYIVGGDGGSTDANWQDFVDDDQGSLTAGRFGHVLTNESGIEILGKIIRGRTSAGTVTATEFTSSAESITWPGGFVAAGWNELEDDLGNASTVISEANTQFGGKGLSAIDAWFDTETGVVGGVTDEISFAVNHQLSTGDAVLYSKNGGTEAIGLTDATEYWVRVTDVDTISLHTYKGDSYADLNIISLTPSTAGNGESHVLTRQIDVRPDYNATGTAGTATYTGCTFSRFRELNLNSAVTFNSCNLLVCSALDLNQGTLSGCTIVQPLLLQGGVFLTTGDLEDLSNCSFEAHSFFGGHAIEITTAGTYTFTGNTFSGYWSHGGVKGDGAVFGTTSGVTDGTEVITTENTHGFTTMDAVYYNDGGGSQTIGLTDGARYYVNVISTTTLSLHATKEDASSDSNRINLTGAGAETHALYSAHAEILNNSGGLVTINVTGGDGVYVRNFGNSDTAVVNVSVSLEVNGVTEGTRCSMVGNGGIENGVEVLAGYADSTGKVTGAFSGTTPQAVFVKARNSGIVSAIIQDDASVFTDYTDEGRERVGADDVVLLPAVPAAADACYIAGLAEFSELLFDISTAGTTYVGTWEYWNGAWVALSVVDNTNSFQSAGWNTVEFVAPSDWVTTSVNSQGPFLYIRFRVTTGGGTGPSAEYVTLSKTTKYQPFNGAGTILTGTGLTSTAVWIEDTIA